MPIEKRVMIKRSQDERVNAMIQKQFTVPNFFFVESKKIYVQTVLQLLSGQSFIPKDSINIKRAKAFVENPTIDAAEAYKKDIVAILATISESYIEDQDRESEFLTLTAYGEQAKFRSTLYLKAQACYGYLLDMLYETRKTVDYNDSLVPLYKELELLGAGPNLEESFENESLKIQTVTPDHKKYFQLLTSYMVVFQENHHTLKRLHILTAKFESAYEEYEVELLLSENA